ncbi:MULTISPECIES: TonB-dependent siderophore receptor [unclassified Ectothiorhodospira]|uniref:TonB-dependent receptor plug domain-containing protein n=1 Tax=unclassified Ectothiorhodospira TaxID=2684909 RepID=UPI001EE97D09|nr:MULTISPECIES: hypothetical protein [unclassified Ectothiorhodospira]MCG5517194.1 hypothetical protein [Ectothiorhodospira sp. 9100]MCG5520126.1 hypothetical protein [Ectothiorhodospira sp. 9905]
MSVAVCLAVYEVHANEATHAGATDAHLETIMVRPIGQTPLDGERTAAGRYRFDARYIERFGGADGSVDGVLRLVPGLQFGESALTTESLLDLRPESFSISGGRFYENQFLLDGMSITNRLDPASTNPNAISDVPGHEQSQFIDSALIGEIRVFDSNVPAEFSRFTGGVVEVETRRAGMEADGSVSYSATRSDWVSYRTFTRDWDPDSGTLPPEPPGTPEFSRDRLSLNYATPVGEASGVVIGLSRARSSTPQVTLGRSRSQEQENTNLLLKLTTPLGDRGLIDWSVGYAPYSNDRFIVDAKDSDFTIKGGGYSSTGNLEYAGDRLDHQFRVGVNYSENSRSAPKDFFNWANTRSIDWGRRADVGNSRQGGFGDLDKEQGSLSFRWMAETMGNDLGQAEVRHRFGAEANHQRYRFQRDEDLYVYQNPVINSEVQCRGNRYDCQQREQYFSTRSVYPADDVEVSLNEAGLFGETTLNWKRVTGTVGLRYDHDDFLGNHDIAYRTRGSLDVFDDGRTVVRAGANRYYGAALLTYKLREARAPFFREYRGTTQNVVRDWEVDSGEGTFRYVFEDLDTPFSDELMVGLRQALLGGVLDLQLVQRDNRDEFARTTTDTQPDGYRYYLMNNDGHSRYRGVSASWYREFGETLVGLHLTYSETRTSNADYDDPVDATGSGQYVSYRGERIRYGELDILREDFARPVVANLSLSRPFGERIRADLNTRYRGRQSVITRTGRVVDGELVELPSGERVFEQLDEYERESRPVTFITDLSLSYSQPMPGATALTAQVQVNNLFDERTHTVPSGQSGVEIGRHYWVSLKYDF